MGNFNSLAQGQACKSSAKEMVLEVFENNFELFFYLFFHENICCWYILELPHLVTIRYV